MIEDIGENDLVIVARNRTINPPMISIYIRDQQIGLIQRLSLDVSSKDNLPKIEIEIYNGDGSEKLISQSGSYLSLLEKLLPFATIREVGPDGNVTRERGMRGTLVRQPTAADKEEKPALETVLSEETRNRIMEKYFGISVKSPIKPPLVPVAVPEGSVCIDCGSANIESCEDTIDPK